MSTLTISETLNDIFACLPEKDQLRLRRFPKFASTGEAVALDPTAAATANISLPVGSADCMLGLLQQPLVMDLVSEFLDPFDLQNWAGCCRATYRPCRRLLLDQLFSTFRILKRYTDRIPNNNNIHQWKLVIQILMEALQRLYDTYGPYHVHPLHAAIVGEVIFLRFFPDRTRHTFHSPDHFVAGNRHDSNYYYNYEFMDDYLEYITAHPECVSPGAAQTLAKEGRWPFIHIFCQFEEETDESTVQHGLCFLDQAADDDHVASLQLFSFPQEFACPETDQEFQDLYSKNLTRPKKGGNEFPIPLAQEFCQGLFIYWYRGLSGDEEE